MTSAVLDTNVLASGFAGFTRPGSTPGQLIRAWLAGRFTVLLSEHIHAEVERTFREPYFSQRLTAEQTTNAQTLLRRRAALVPLTVQVQGVASHPEDDLILATAVSAQANYLVTGDKQLQDLVSYQGVLIVSPRAFLEVLERDQGVE